jgi:hypothetical protein
VATRWVERWVGDRLLERLEPYIEAKVRAVLTSDRHRAALLDLLAEAATDLIVPGEAGASDVAEILVMKLAVRLSKARPEFRARLREALEGLDALSPA